jgi:hypothetical protein
MTKLRKSLLVTVSVLILLPIGLLFIVPNTRNKENPENKTVAVKNKFNPPITNVQNVENEKKCSSNKQPFHGSNHQESIKK